MQPAPDTWRYKISTVSDSSIQRLLEVSLAPNIRSRSLESRYKLPMWAIGSFGTPDVWYGERADSSQSVDARYRALNNCRYTEDLLGLFITKYDLQLSKDPQTSRWFNWRSFKYPKPSTTVILTPRPSDFTL